RALGHCEGEALLGRERDAQVQLREVAQRAQHQRRVGGGGARLAGGDELEHVALGDAVDELGPWHLHHRGLVGGALDGRHGGAREVGEARRVLVARLDEHHAHREVAGGEVDLPLPLGRGGQRGGGDVALALRQAPQHLLKVSHPHHLQRPALGARVVLEDLVLEAGDLVAVAVEERPRVVGEHLERCARRRRLRRGHRAGVARGGRQREQHGADRRPRCPHDRSLRLSAQILKVSTSCLSDSDSRASALAAVVVCSTAARCWRATRAMESMALTTRSPPCFCSTVASSICLVSWFIFSAALVISEAPSAFSLAAPAICCARCAILPAVCSSWAAPAACSSVACEASPASCAVRSMEEMMRLITSSVSRTTVRVSNCTVLISSPISLVELAERSARRLTSSATTAKPLPASPARAASMAALSDSRLVWSAIPSITL